MFIHNLEIENFRGIKKADITFPKDSNIICLIGSGDSTKSTILKAIEYVFSNSWNLNVYDNDFYDCKTDNPIVIRATFSEFPKKLLAEDKFGFYLRKLGVKYDGTSNDDPEDGEEVCLTIQLSIDDSLEPTWTIVKNNTEPKTISTSDRKLLPVASVGDNCSRDMMWNKYSVLQKYADSKDALRNEHTKVMRKVSTEANLESLDTIADTVVKIGERYGVGFNGEIKNRMTIQNNSITSIVGLYDGDSPLSQRGNGSQKLLSMGLNIEASEDNIILLMDEVEIGLEPYRLRSLIGTLRQNRNDGQVIMTTHSPVVVSECSISEIMIIHSRDGVTTAIPVKREDDDDINKQLQAHVRKFPEALLSPKIIVCEGKTEIGFIRSIDKYLDKEYDFRMACSGISTALGNGDELCAFAKTFHELGYQVCIFMDSDLPSEEENKEEMRRLGIDIFDWNSGDSIEEGVFSDIPNNVASQLINIAVCEKGRNKIENVLNAKRINYHFNDDVIVIEETKRDRLRLLGTIAKSKGNSWYKRIDLGEELGDIIFGNIADISEETKLIRLIKQIIEWVK